MSKRYVGERVLQKCGEWAEIIELLPNYMCIIKFDNGIEKLCKRASFSSGVASSKTWNHGTRRYIGERILQNCGEYAEITELLPKQKCRVRFDSGLEKICKRNSFSSGDIPTTSHKRLYVGERVLQNCGEYAEIVELLPNGRCMVKFDSGVEKLCTRSDFSSGGVYISSKKRVYVGEKAQQNCGAVAEIVKITEGVLCTVRWEDGSEAEITRASFRNCCVLPKFISKYGFYYAYTETMEILLGMYFDTTLGRYVGVLRRDDGTRYIRVLGEDCNA